MSRIGKRVQEERIKKGMTPKQLGKKCGVAESFILDVESGKRIMNEKLFAQISKVLGGNLQESMILETAVEDKKPMEKQLKPAVKTDSVKRSQVEPLAQWGEALSNIIKRIPIYDMQMIGIKDYKSFPIIDKKVEGFHPDKLVYVELSDDTMAQYRMKKGDRCLIYINHEFTNGSFHLLEYDNKKCLRRVKKIEGTKIQLVEGTREDKAVIKDLKEVKVIGKLIRVEIDF
ncbi:Helix-turn-helix domain-containing protein [Natronincola peptidivorans]|uniref:Helix-turn-helix domain-containing protein n=1 Tax=Natronincola peptidivorans TaxID=426128 RepID=A0A1I0CD65_9FIRM|nr:helix-turn-helix transcriptional regulator [Natronincola peptidivorans]SET17224.1 Helix-turn-helix domain-containing protein [Natronincola peptidivorans]